MKNRDRYFVISTSLIGFITGLTSFLTTILPMYNISGVVKGVVSLNWYYIVAFGKTASFSILDTISFLTIIVNIANFFVISSSITSITFTIRMRENPFIYELLFGSSLVHIMYSGLLLGLFRVLSREVVALNTVYREITNAGILFAGQSRVSETIFSKIFFTVIPLPLILGFTYLVFSSILFMKYLRQKSYT